MANNKQHPEEPPPYEETRHTRHTMMSYPEHDATHKNLSKVDAHRAYYLYKGNGLSSKARILSSEGTNYSLKADIHRSKTSSIQLQQGKGSNVTSIGDLTFPPTHNGFHVRIAQTGEQMVQVKAKAGYPHPNSYEFNIPATITLHPRKMVWKRLGTASTTKGYRLHDECTDELLASWTLVSGARHQVLFQWHVEPSSYWEDVVVMLSFVGVVSRLKLRGKNHEGLPSGMLRYNGFWFMAILGTAAVA